ncbi:methyl-accepting chemotaxis protein [Sulfurospirillum sp. 1612]|uniref:methyl-accepting chemotaxis protein n=1 Tax=Sulfurospirillum sp. 1612 TaxID=3094835 RepID=UPI002F92D79E
MKLATKTLLVVLSFLTLTAVSIVSISAYFSYQNSQKYQNEFKKQILNQAKEKVKTEIDIAISTAQSLYQEEKKLGFKEERIKEDIKNALRGISFDKGEGYFFIYDTQGIRVMHPKLTDTEGKNYINLKDSNGVKIIKELIKVAQNGGGYVTYYFSKKKGGKPYPKLSYAKEFEPYGWVVGTGEYIDHLDTKMAQMKTAAKTSFFNDMMTFVTIILLCAIIGSILIYFLLNMMLSRPLKKLAETTKDLASGNGDLTKKLTVKGKDEIAMASTEINNFIEKVRIMTQNAKSLSAENSSISNELSNTSLEVGKLVENSTVLVETTTKQAGGIYTDMTASIEEAKTAKGDLETANNSLDEARDAILKLTQDIQESAAIEVEMAGRIQQLSSDAEQVKQVLNVISDIAEQTNLLALNAAIEAARAGEHGRGFAVVADEVRKLAERTQKSLSEINATINVIVQSITESSQQMTQNSEHVEELSVTAQSVESKINDLSSVMVKANHMAENSVDQYIQSGNNIKVIINNIEEVNKISAKNARSIEEIASAAEHMNSMTETLNNKLSEFRT